MVIRLEGKVFSCVFVDFLIRSKISPAPRNTDLEKGYLTLPSEWLSANPKFQLDIPLKPRFVAPHPHTRQDIVALARGPVLYCVEDFDNPWVDDHFKSLVLDPAAAISEEKSTDIEIGQSYISLVAHNAASFLKVDTHIGPLMPVGQIVQNKPGVEMLRFTPYCLRDNRGGKGHMRVGIRRKS